MMRSYAATFTVVESFKFYTRKNIMSRKLAAYWQGKTVLITGASSGLGWSLVHALAPYKVHFGLLSRRQEKLQELADQLQDSGSKFWTKSCDIQNRSQVEECVGEFLSEVGQIDVAWVNSGVSHDSSYESWDWDLVEETIDTNLRGAIYTTKACLDTMVPKKTGTIVGIGSAASMRGLPRRSLYSLSKIGLQYFLESMAVELPDIQFTMIHPGYVDTPINRDNKGRFWLMTPDEAALLMIKAVAKRKSLYIYPWKMSVLYRIRP